MAILGIDLGTTNSLGAVYRNNKVELIPNRFGSYLTPSVVSVDDHNQIIVGHIAKERLVTHPDVTAASFKKDMGTGHSYKMGKREFSPEELSSFVIHSIVKDAEDYLQETIDEVVISVPAYFNDKQRVATKRAGALAGVKTERIINEPSAAAMASYFDNSREQLFLIFDFGGGTLDISIVECFQNMVEILSVSGDNRLGGDNFHEIMVQNFLKEHRIPKNQITAKEYAILLRQAELCKQRLSTEKTAKMTALIGESTYQSEYSNQRLLEESGEIFARIKKVLSHALRDGDVRLDEIDSVIMVGGSSKMPLIQSYLQHILKQKPIVAGNCDEMIARGLGLVCAVKERNEDIKDYVLTDICPFTLGTDVYNESDPRHSYMHPIVPRNTVLPCSRVKRFYTVKDDQQRVEFEILQGEQVYAKDNLCLDKIAIAVPKNKKGQESVDVRFTYDINGILLIDITVVSTGKSISKVVSQNVKESDLEKKIKELEKLRVHPKELSENQYILEKLSALYEEAPTYMREPLSNAIKTFSILLESQDARKIKKYRTYIESFIRDYDYYDPFEEEFSFDHFEENWDENTEDDEEDEFKFFTPSKGGNPWTS